MVVKAVKCLWKNLEGGIITFISKDFCALVLTKKNSFQEKPATKGAKDGKKDKQDDDNESDDSESSSETETSSGTDDSMSEDDSNDDSEDEETRVKPEVGKKRAVPTALKTPASDKKAKISTPKKETGVDFSDDSSGDDSESSSETETSNGTDDSLSEDNSSEDSEDEETPVKPEVGKKRAVPIALNTPASDKKAKISTPKETGVDSSDDSSGDDSESSSETETSSGTDDSLSEDDSSDDSEDEEAPVKPEVGKKRAVPTALETPALDKKAKISTPKETAKQASKTPADGRRKEKGPKSPADSKVKEKSPKSGSYICKSCRRLSKCSSP